MNLFIKVLYQKGDDPFIFEVCGPITKEDFEEIEEEMKRNMVEDPGLMFNHGTGEYHYKMSYFNGQYGPEGRVELRPHWNFEEVKEVLDGTTRASG